MTGNIYLRIGVSLSILTLIYRLIIGGIGVYLVASVSIFISMFYFLLKKFIPTNKSEHSLLDVNEELNFLIASLYSFAKNYNIEINYFSTLENQVFIKADKNNFQKALTNLVKNGFESSQKGSIEIAVHEMLSSILIVIEDNGKGLTKDQLKLLGKPIHTTKNNVEEPDIAVSYNLIGSMSGKIEVASELGRGTIFSVIIPKAAELKV
ncbi:sensor histidine kinase [Neobacillus sp. LXY-4]|uniref:sensor histidine kinase n=1 Tax=Neobacillus sp. LXY-4 TaxID=3379826 RepID=UPI003EE186B8